MRDFPLHSQTIRGYDSSAPAKSGVGIGVPEQLSVTNDAPASFLLSAYGGLGRGFSRSAGFR